MDRHDIGHDLALTWGIELVICVGYRIRRHHDLEWEGRRVRRKDGTDGGQGIVGVVVGPSGEGGGLGTVSRERFCL